MGTSLCLESEPAANILGAGIEIMKQHGQSMTNYLVVTSGPSC